MSRLQEERIKHLGMADGSYSYSILILFFYEGDKISKLLQTMRKLLEDFKLASHG